MKRGPTLHDAAKDNNSVLAFDLLRAGRSKDGRNEEKQTPLHVACACGSMDVARVLIEYKADLFATDSNGQTPMMIAKEHKHKALVRFLVEQGVPCPSDIPLKALGLPDDLSAIHFAVKARNKASLRKVIELISDECGEDGEYFERLNAPDKFGLTPLHLAAQMGVEDCVYELVSEEVNPSLQDKFGRTPLHLAITENNEECALKIIHWSENIDIADQWKNTPLFYALRLRNENIIRALILKGAATENLFELAKEMKCLDIMIKAIAERQKILQENPVEENPVNEDAVKPIVHQFESLALQKKLSQEELVQGAAVEPEEDKTAVLDSQSEQKLSPVLAMQVDVDDKGKQELDLAPKATSVVPTRTTRNQKKKMKKGGNQLG